MKKSTQSELFRQLLRETVEEVGEKHNPEDVIAVDVPLFIRLMEFAREDAKTDMDLHDVTEKLIKMSATGKTLSMDDYAEIVSAAGKPGSE